MNNRYARRAEAAQERHERRRERTLAAAIDLLAELTATSEEVSGITVVLPDGSSHFISAATAPKGKEN